VITLVVAIVGTVAAILAAIFAYSEWRSGKLRPNLELAVHGRPDVQSDPASTTIRFRLELHSTGKGTVRYWFAKLRVPAGGESNLALESKDDQTEQYVSASARWTVLQWRAAGEGDAIPGGGIRPLAGWCVLRVSDGNRVVSVDYRLDAQGMRVRDGVLVVAIEDDSSVQLQVR